MSVAYPHSIMSNGVEIDANAGEVYGVRKLRRSGDSYVVSIPPEVLETSDLEPEQATEVVTSIEGGGILIRSHDPGQKAENGEDDS